MRRISYWPYIFLLLFYLCIFNAPKVATDRLRSVAVCSFSPLWQALFAIKRQCVYLMTLPCAASEKTPSINAEQVDRLQQENALLHAQLDKVREWLLLDDRVQEQYERLQQLGKIQDVRGEFFKRRYQELSERLELHLQSIAASVVFREPSTWSSALWIDVGEKQNKIVGKKIISKNSPVLLGTSIVGVVEYVGENRSRIRLITDQKLAPSVRVLRGQEQDRFLIERVDALALALERREDLFVSREMSSGVLSMLSQLRARLQVECQDLYLAKGEIFGSSSPLWRSRSPILKGVGFNYDFADEEGPARDLRTGEPYGSEWKKEPIALLRPGDILVTTGLDGVFPAGYRVAMVVKVQLLKEGASSYEIEAVATAGNLDDISHVTVLPALQAVD